TATGKIDRRTLPAPERTGLPHVRVAPRDDLERAIAQVWAETLGEGGVEDVEKNFFEAGGNSLLAVRLAATVRRQLGAELPVAAIFREPTIAGLARLMRGAGQDRSEVEGAVTGRAGHTSAGTRGAATPASALEELPSPSRDRSGIGSPLVTLRPGAGLPPLV